MADTADLVNALQASRGAGALPAPVVVNPLAAMSGAVQTAGGIYDLREKQATEAVGNILQQSTDANGNVDYAKAHSLASQAGPVVQMGMQKMLLDTSTLRSAQLTRNLAQNSAMINSIQGLQRLPDDQLASGVLDQVQRLVQQQILPPDQAATLLFHARSDDPKTLRQQIENLRISLLPSGEQQSAIYGTPGTMTGPGGRQIGTTQSVQTGALTSPQQAGVRGGPSQEWLNAPIITQDQRKYLPNGEPNPNYGQTYRGTQGDYYGVPGSATDQSLGTGRPPPALVNPNGPTKQPPAAAPGAPPPGAKPAGMSPADEQTIKDAGPKFAAHADQDTQAQTQLATLGNMLADTSQFFTGPQAGIVGKVRNLAIGLGIPGANVEAQTAKESFGKLAAMLANAQGAGSDARMNVNIAANPHEELSAPGVDLILRQLQGNADFIRARAKLAQQYPNRGDYQGFQDRIKGLDPRVFQLQRMTQPQRDTYWNALDSAAKDQMTKAINEADRLKVL